jgi:hypothetical protein
MSTQAQTGMATSSSVSAVIPPGRTDTPQRRVSNLFDQSELC